MDFKIEPHFLKACAPAMSTEQTRYYLMGVHIFERDGKIIYEATNGHLLIRCTSNRKQDSDLKGLNMIVPDFLVKEVSKKAFLSGFGCIGQEFVDSVVDGQSILLEMPDGTVSRKLIDGTYPQADLVFPSKRTGVSEMPDLGFNLSYMADIQKSLKSFTGTLTANFSIAENSAPLYMTNKTSEYGVWEAVLMPVRV